MLRLLIFTDEGKVVYMSCILWGGVLFGSRQSSVQPEIKFINGANFVAEQLEMDKRSSMKFEDELKPKIRKQSYHLIEHLLGGIIIGSEEWHGKSTKI